MKLTKVQITTLIAIILYVIWEISVRNWTKTEEPNGPIIRVDLLIILPILLVMIIISI